MDAGSDPRRGVPSVDQVLRRPPVDALCRQHGRDAVAWHVRELLEEARRAAAHGDDQRLRDVVEGLDDALARRMDADVSLRPVLNATGVVLHTNLGRAPLPDEALQCVWEIAAGYSTLEFDLATGERGERGARLAARLRRLVGAEAALVVNNNAAAVLLALDTLASGREVVVSRGELVEIGGSFRIPDVLRKSGGRLVEVGTTNRTRLADYRDAIGPDTGILLKVHPSNFRVVGYTETVSAQELASLGRNHAITVVEDLGSGALRGGIAGIDEPTVEDSLRAGVDLVTFSGDKLLGGPQAGLVVGRAGIVAALHRNPLYRALRVDKMTMAALDVVLALYERGDLTEIPVQRMLRLQREDLRPRCERLRQAVASPTVQAEIIDGVSAVGGGADPLAALPTVLLALRAGSANDLAARLRAGTPAVVARVQDDRVLLDLRTIDPAADAALLAAVVAAVGPAD